jgi:hypothetical protein
MTSNEETTDMKVVDLRKLRNFAVDKFFIWLRLVPLKTDLHSVLYSMSRTKTAYGCIWVCGVVVEEASREVRTKTAYGCILVWVEPKLHMDGFEPRQPRSAATLREKCATCDGDGWLAGRWGLSCKKKFFLFIFGF